MSRAAPHVPQRQQRVIVLPRQVLQDFPRGQLLSDVLATRRLGPSEVAHMGVHLATALEALHTRGLTHGFISPQSVLLLPDGRAVLWDTALVLGREGRGGQPDRQLARLARCARFLAPERARGGAATPAADIWSLGAVLCAAGGAATLPLTESVIATLHRVATGQWRPSPPPEWPVALRSLVEQMLRETGPGRPRAVAVAEELRWPHTCAADEPRLKRATRWVRRVWRATRGFVLSIPAGVRRFA